MRGLRLSSSSTRTRSAGCARIGRPTWGSAPEHSAGVFGRAAAPRGWRRQQKCTLLSPSAADVEVAGHRGAVVTGEERRNRPEGTPDLWRLHRSANLSGTNQPAGQVALTSLPATGSALTDQRCQLRVSEVKGRKWRAPPMWPDRASRVCPSESWLTALGVCGDDFRCPRGSHFAPLPGVRMSPRLGQTCLERAWSVGGMAMKRAPAARHARGLLPAHGRHR